MSIPCASKFYVGPDGITWREPGEDHYPVREDFRPLVVLDPEDAEQVERLREAMGTCPRNGEAWCIDSGCGTERLTAGLRSLVAPPKPDEPTGHMAVVEDDCGERWVNWRDPRDNGTHEEPWVNASDSETAREYRDINVVRVLSEGVQS